MGPRRRIERGMGAVVTFRQSPASLAGAGERRGVYPNLKLHLWMSGIRQNRLAKILGMDESALSRIMNGFRKPSAEVRSRIAVLLNRDEEWLFEPGESNGSAETENSKCSAVPPDVSGKELNREIIP